MKQQEEKNTITPKERANALAQKVRGILIWDEMDYNRFQYEAGLDYLKCYLKGSDMESMREVISANADFWKWWRNHWANRDQAFLEWEANTTYSLAELREFYTEMNDAATLAAAIYPNGIILKKSYKQLMTSLYEKA